VTGNMAATQPRVTNSYSCNTQYSQQLNLLYNNAVSATHAFVAEEGLSLTDNAIRISGENILCSLMCRQRQSYGENALAMLSSECLTPS